MVIDLPSGIGPGRRHAGRGPWVAAAAAAPLPPAIGVTDVPIDVLVGVAALLVIGVVVAAVIVTRHMTSDGAADPQAAGHEVGNRRVVRPYGAPRVQPDGIHALPGWRPRRTTVLGSLPELLPLLGLGLVAGAYFVTRFDGRWAEGDSGSMTQAIRSLASTGHFETGVTNLYSNGFGYQAVSTAILAFTGLDVVTLQQHLYPLISAVLVVPAWVLYRELTGSSQIAGLATLLLLVAPEYVFSISRASHERLDRAFMFIAVWLLVRSVRNRGDPARFRIHLALALVMTYSLVCTNALFGMSFVLAMGTAFAIAWLANRLWPAVRQVAGDASRLLGWVAVAAAVITGLVILIIYPPILDSIRALSVIPGALVDLILNGGVSKNPYATLSSAWVSTAIYLLLSAANFVLLATSALVWIWMGWGWLRGRTPPTIGAWMLWSLYAAFAIQGAATIVSDRTGALQGNAQYRAFSLFATVAAPLVAYAVAGRPRRRLRPILVAFVAFAAGATYLKATLDPLASNRWLFYTDAEVQGLLWADANQRGSLTWIGDDDRLSAAWQMVVGKVRAGNGWDVGAPSATTSTFLVSEPMRLQFQRLGVTLPPLATANVVYDNGSVTVARTR